MNWHDICTFDTSGDTPRFKQLVNMIFREVTKAASLNFIIQTDIASPPCAFLGLSDLMMFNILSSEMRNSLIKEVGTGASCGILLPVSIVVH